MTTFRSDDAKVMLDDLLADPSDGWTRELYVITGYNRAAYEGLRERLDADGFTPSYRDKRMMSAAEFNLRLFPYVTTERVRAAFGDEWEARLEAFAFPLPVRRQRDL